MMREFNCLLCSNFRWHNVKRSASTAYALHVYIIYIILIEMFEFIRSTTLGNGYNWMEEKNVCYFILQNSSIQLVATVCLFLLPFFEKKKKKKTRRTRFSICIASYRAWHRNALIKCPDQISLLWWNFAVYFLLSAGHNWKNDDIWHLTNILLLAFNLVSFII